MELAEVVAPLRIRALTPDRSELLLLQQVVESSATEIDSGARQEARWFELLGEMEGKARTESKQREKGERGSVETAMQSTLLSRTRI